MNFILNDIVCDGFDYEVNTCDEYDRYFNTKKDEDIEIESNQVVLYKYNDNIYRFLNKVKCFSYNTVHQMVYMLDVNSGEYCVVTPSFFDDNFKEMTNKDFLR